MSVHDVMLQKGKGSVLRRFILCLGCLQVGILLHAQSVATRLVEVAEVWQEELKKPVELVGTVMARKQSALSPRLNGLVESLSVDFGTEVKVGDPLLKLDSTLSALELKQIDQQIQAAESELEDAKRRFEETKQLAVSGGIAKSDHESRQALLRVREAQLSELQVRREEQRERLERHTLRAPFSGVISKRYTQVGEWVQAQEAVLELVELDQIYFDVHAPQSLFEELTSDVEVAVKVNAKPEQAFAAEIAVKVPVKDPVNRTFLVRLSVDAPNRALLPGASGSAIFEIGNGTPETVIPRDALVRQPDGSRVVWVVDSSQNPSIVSARSVKIGQQVGAKVEIVSGLEMGESVVIRGNENLVPDQPVEVVSP
ncbi:MAG: efflux RND transporter periplasmic adaptor subunit [Opitutales bacterium]|nr:efflux RND transporter periplasmic adaptor subunit [Opitutales bacterium]